MDKQQTSGYTPLYDHPDRCESLGRRRRLIRQKVDPDQLVGIIVPVPVPVETSFAN